MVEIRAMKRRQNRNTSSFSYGGNTQKKVKIIVPQISSKETRLAPLVLQTMTKFSYCKINGREGDLCSPFIFYNAVTGNTAQMHKGIRLVLAIKCVTGPFHSRKDLTIFL